jgi:hypothetical protein
VSLTSQDQSGVNNPFPSSSNTAPIAIGVVVSVHHVNQTVTIDPIPPYNDLNNPFTLTTAHYLFFSKNRVANISGIVGYFAETEYRNYSKLQTEIFATAVDYVESSK